MRYLFTRSTSNNNFSSNVVEQEQAARANVESMHRSLRDRARRAWLAVSAEEDYLEHLQWQESTFQARVTSLAAKAAQEDTCRQS